MYFDGTSFAQHAHDRPLGVTPDDRIVDDDEPLAADVVAQRVQLESDAQLPDRLRRLDERTPDVSVFDQAGAVWNAGLGGVTDGGRRARLRNRYDQVGLDRVLAGEGTADRHPRGVHVAAGDCGVRSRQIDVFEQAALGLGHAEAARAQAVLVDGDQLAGLDLANDARADDVQRGRLARDDPAPLQPAEDQRAHAVDVARRVQRVLVHEDEAERAAQCRQDLERGGLDGHVGPGRQ